MKIYKISNSQKTQPYNIYYISGDEEFLIPGMEDIFAYAVSPNQAFHKFLTYPKVKEYYEMFSLVARVNRNRQTQDQVKNKALQESKKNRKEEDDKRVQDMWWNK